MTLSDLQAQIDAFSQQSTETAQEMRSELASIKGLLLELITQKNPSSDQSVTLDPSRSSSGIFNGIPHDLKPSDLTCTTLSFRPVETLKPQAEVLYSISKVFDEVIDITMESLVPSITVEDESKTDFMDDVLDDLAFLKEVKPMLTIIDECLEDAGLLEVVLNEHGALGEVQSEAGSEFIEFIFSSSLSSYNSGTGVEKLVSESVYQNTMSSNISCTQGVRINVHEKLISYFLPPKPPDEYMNVVTILNSNHTVQYSVRCSDLWLRTHHMLELPSVQENLIVPRTCAEIYLMELEVPVGMWCFEEILWPPDATKFLVMCLKLITLSPILWDFSKLQMKLTFGGIKHGLCGVTKSDCKVVKGSHLNKLMLQEPQIALLNIRERTKESSETSLCAVHGLLSHIAGGFEALKPPDKFFSSLKLLDSCVIVDFLICLIFDNESSYERVAVKSLGHNFMGSEFSADQRGIYFSEYASHHEWLQLLSCPKIFYLIHKHLSYAAITLEVMMPSVKKRDSTSAILCPDLFILLAMSEFEVNGESVNICKFKVSSSYVIFNRPFSSDLSLFITEIYHKWWSTFSICRNGYWSYFPIKYLHLRYSFYSSPDIISQGCFELCVKSFWLITLSVLIRNDSEEGAENINVSMIIWINTLFIILQHQHLLTMVICKRLTDHLIWCFGIQDSLDGLIVTVIGGSLICVFSEVFTRKRTQYNYYQVLAFPFYTRSFGIKYTISEVDGGANKRCYTSTSFSQLWMFNEMCSGSLMIGLHTQRLSISFLGWEWDFYCVTLCRSIVKGRYHEFAYEEAPQWVTKPPPLPPEFLLLDLLTTWYIVDQFSFTRSSYAGVFDKNIKRHNGWLFYKGREVSTKGPVQWQGSSGTSNLGIFTRLHQHVPDISSLRTRMLPRGEYCDRITWTQLSCKCLGPIPFPYPVCYRVCYKP